MGKSHQQQTLPQQAPAPANSASSRFFCDRCSAALSRVTGAFSVRCVVVLVLSLAVFVVGLCWLLPLRVKSGFDAKATVKSSASIQASFMLDKPVRALIPSIAKLEYEIFEEIGLPNTKVAILSMRKSYYASNETEVVFGVLSDPTNAAMSPVSLSILKSSLIELFLPETNLTLTQSTFGQPSNFEVLKFPGGITVIPSLSSHVWQLPQVLFNFTLNNSIKDIQDSFVKLRDQLKNGLDLEPNESMYVKVTSEQGSTVSPPVIVQASIVSAYGGIQPSRLKQLAKFITDSPAKNLGLDHLTFGKVKSVILSSYLKGKLHAIPPAASPGPSPEPAASPHLAPTPSTISPAPKSTMSPAPESPPMASSGESPPAFSPVPYVLYGTRIGLDMGENDIVNSSPSSLAAKFQPVGVSWILGSLGLFILYLLW